MSSLETCFMAIVFIALTTSSAPVQANKSWQQWDSLRWSGLQQYSQGNIQAADNKFEQALAEAKRVQPESEMEVVSIHDLAQVYDGEGNAQKAESYCNAALELGKRVCPHSPVIVQILATLVDLKRGERKPDEVGKLYSEMDKVIKESPDARTIGAANMEKDGTIKLRLQAEQGGMIGEATLSCAPGDPDYKDTLMHLGPMKPGDSKFVTPWIEK